MGSQHDERDRDARADDRPGPHFGHATPRERYAPESPWPMGAVDGTPGEAPVSRSLEQVGLILRRLELDQRHIVRLRSETRAILDGLAA